MENQYKPTILYFAKPFFVLLGLCAGVCLVLACSGLWSVVLSFSTVYSWAAVIALLGLAVATVVAFGRFAMPLFYIRKAREHVFDLRGGRAYTYVGGLGVGKTLSMTFDGLVLAEVAEADLRFRELQYRAAEARGEHYKTIEDWYLRVIVRETIALYDNLNCIPYLMSNYGVRKDGRYSLKLDKDYFLQRKRAPENVVMLYDEAADDFDNKRVNARAESYLAEENALINETMSKFRHLYNAYVIMAEQDGQEIYIGMRRVMYKNRYLRDMEHVCQPVRLQRRFDKLREKVLCADHCEPRQLEQLRRMRAQIQKIGFFKIHYRDDGNTQLDGKGLDEGYYIIPHNLDFEYESRAYLYDNRALRLQLEPETHKTLYSERKPGA